MKKVLFLLLINGANLWAQQTKYVVTPTVAYNNEKASKAVGIFLRGATISKYEEVNYTYRITLDTGEVVYVNDTYNLKNTLNANDDFKPSPKVIVEEDEYYGSPHLFTTVAGLKVRESLTGPTVVIGTLLNGSVVPITYYSYNPDAWTTIEINGKNGFIPMKFVGQRPAMEDLITAYKKATVYEDQKKYAERILELGWNSEHSETSKALKIYADFANKNNLPNVAELSNLQAKALDAINLEDHFGRTDLITKKQFGFTFNNDVEPKNGFSLTTLEKHLGKVIQSYSNLDDCALGDYEGNVIFNKAECISHDVNKTYMLRNMNMTHSNGFKIKNHLLNENTSEIEFLKIGTGLISRINSQTSTYSIFIDETVYEFSFQNAKLHKVSIVYYC